MVLPASNSFFLPGPTGSTISMCLYRRCPLPTKGRLSSRLRSSGAAFPRSGSPTSLHFDSARILAPKLTMELQLSNHVDPPARVGRGRQTIHAADTGDTRSASWHDRWSPTGSTRPGNYPVCRVAELPTTLPRHTDGVLAFFGMPVPSMISARIGPRCAMRGRTRACAAASTALSDPSEFVTK